MSIIDFGSFTSLLDERYREIEQDELASINDIIGQIYTIRDSDRRQERRGAVGEMGQWPEFSGQLTYDRPYEGYNVVTTHREFAVGMRITQRMIEDDLTGIFDGEDFASMVRAGAVTRNVHAARLFNFATSNDQFFYTRSEAVPLASNSHTTRVPGVSTATGFDNLATAALSPTSYRLNRIQMRQFRNDRGDRTGIMADELWVPTDLEPTAREILESEGRPDTANRADNVDRGSAKLYVVLEWTDSNDWALCNSMLRKKNCIWWERAPVRYRRVAEFDSYQVKIGGRGRWGTMVADWRFILYASVA